VRGEYRENGKQSRRVLDNFYRLKFIWIVFLVALTGVLLTATSLRAQNPPVAYLVAHPTSGSAPLTVQFNDLSINSPTSWGWDFGDGDWSTEQNPFHVYQTEGTYWVTLYVTNSFGYDEATYARYIVVSAGIAPVVDFSGTPRSGRVPLTVQFTDLSTKSPFVWNWDFGDGTSSVEQNPSHIYEEQGAYAVTLSATNAFGSHSVTKIHYITVSPALAPVLDFSGSPTSGSVPLTVQFTDQSPNALTWWYWDFGDGGSSSAQNPTHVYNTAGTYAVTLEAGNEYAQNSFTRANYITVSPGPPPVADFTGSPTSGSVPLTVQFTDHSSNSPSWWFWDFGDNQYSFEQNPFHVYDTEGIYTVTLEVGNDSVSNSETKADYITVGPASSGTIYFPHIASNGIWETEIALINTSSTETITGQLKAASDSGQEVTTGVSTITLGPRGRRQITVGNELSNPDTIGSMVFEGNSPAIRGYTKFSQNGIYRAAIPAVSSVNSGDLYVTHIASNAEWWTGLSLLNTTSQASQVSIEFDNGRSQVVSLAANEHVKFTVEALLGGQPQTNIHSAVIRNGNGVIGLELFGNTATQGNRCLEGILLTDTITTTLYCPHVASDTAWWTGIVAYNPATSASTLTISPYTATGSALAATSQTVNARQKYVGTAEQLGLPTEAAWLQITASTPTTGFELIGTRDSNLLAGYSNLKGGTKEAVLPKLEKQGSTQVVLVNLEQDSAMVTLTAYNDSGTQIATATLTVSGYGKVMDTAETLLSRTLTGATFLGYSSDKYLISYQLNTSADNTLLDGLPGL
jgi:PKD repeat protein